jgi:hypothetical protein
MFSPRTFQLARARSGHHETHLARLDQPVDLVQERWQLLDLVDDDLACPPRVGQVLQTVGVPEQLDEGGFLE